MAVHKALGRGLDALFSSNSTNGKAVTQNGVQSEVRDISIDQIKPNRHQPRTQFDQAALEELAQSIKTHGLAQPLLVTEMAEGSQYELVAGERRLRAAKIAGLKTVPCILRRLSNRERFELALIENIQRQDLDPLEEATALDGLMREYGLTQEQVSEALGKSRSSVANILRLLKLHEDVQAALRAGQITEGHAKWLAGVPAHAEQLRLLSEILEKNLTVRELEALLGEKPRKKAARARNAEAPTSTEVKKYEEDFQRKLGRQVQIQSDGQKGWIRFAFYSPEDLDHLCRQLGLADEIIPGPMV